MSQFLDFLIAGVVSGSFYAIMASGLVLTYSTSGVFNFAHGSIAFLIALIYYELNTGLHWPVVPAVIVSVLIIAPLLGLLLDRAMFRRLMGAGTTAQIVATVGLSVAIPALGIFVVQTCINDFHWAIATVNNIISVPGVGPTPPTTFSLGNGVSISSDQIAALAAAVFCAVLLWIITRRTTLGLQMRATVDQRSLAGLRRINPDRVSSIAWMLGTMLAGLTGVLAAPIVSLSASNFTILMLTSAAAAVFALFRSIPIAFAAGIGLGVIEDIMAGYVSPHLNINGFGSAVPFAVLLIGLFILNRTRGRSARVAAQEAAPRDPAADLPSWRRALPWGIASVVLVIYTLAFASEFWTGLIISGLCVALIFLSFVMVTGIGGMVSLAQATFVTAAGMIAGLVISHHVNFDVGLLAGVGTAAAVGAIIALPALRLGGLYLALATLALALIGDLVIFQISPLFNENFGWKIPNPTIGPWQITSERSMAVLMFIVVGLIVLVVRNIQRSATGRAMFAVRSAPIASATSGMSPFRSKLMIFVLSAAIAGLGGVFYASFNGQVNASDFPAETGMLWLAIIVVMGIRKPGNAVIAGLVYTILPHLLTYITASTQIPAILFGLGGVALAKNPEGSLADTAAQFRLLSQKIAARFSKPPSLAMAGAAGAIAAPSEPTVATPSAQFAAPPAEKQVQKLEKQNHGAIEVIEGSNGSAVPAAGAAGAAGAVASTAATPGKAAAPTTPAFANAAPTNGSGSAYPSAALEVRDIRAGYDGVEVLHGVSLHVEPGSVLGLLGANGAGKSTLAKVISGALDPTAGQIILSAQDTSERPIYWRSRNGLLVAPEGRGIFPSLTVEENLRILLPSSDQRELVYGRFEGLARRQSVAAGLLSGGEQQLLSLAPLLIDRPAVLIADEPSLGLSPLVARQVFDIIRELRDDGVAIILIEEKTRDVLAAADRLAMLRVGEIVWQGLPADTSPQQLAAAYLGMEMEMAHTVVGADAAAAGGPVGQP